MVSEADADAAQQGGSFVDGFERVEDFVALVVAEVALVIGFLALVGALDPVLVELLSWQ